MADKEASVSIKITLEDVATAGLDAVNATLTTMGEAATKSAEDVTQAQDSIANLANTAQETADATVTLTEAAQNLEKSLYTVSEVIPQAEEGAYALGDAFNILGAEAKADYETFLGFAEGMGALSEALNLVSQAASQDGVIIEELSQAIWATVTPVEEAAILLPQWADSLQIVHDAAGELGISLDELQGTLDASATAEKEQAEYALDAADMYRQWQEALVSFNEEALQTDAILSEETAAINENADAADRGSKSYGGIGQSMMLMFAGMQALGFLTTNIEKSVTSAGDLQEAFVKVQIATGATGDTLQNLDDTIVSLSDNSKFSTTDIAAEFELIAERSYSASEIVKNGLGQTIIDLAEVTGSQLAPATDLVTSTMRIFTASADQAGRYTSGLLYAFQHGIPDVNLLSTALQHVGPSASALKIPFEDITAALLYLVNHGMPDAGVAGTSLNYMLNAMSAPTSAAGKELTKLGVSAYDMNGNLKSLPNMIQDVVTSIGKLGSESDKASAWKTLFNVRSGQGAKILGSDPNIGADLQAGVSNITSAEGGGGKPSALTKAMGLFDSTFNHSMQALQTTFNSTIALLAIPVLGFLTPILGSLNKLVESFQKGHDGIKLFAAGFLGVIGILGPIGLLIGGIVFLISMMSTPILVVVGGILGLAVAGGALAQHWHPVGGIIQTVSSGFMGFLNAVLPPLQHMGAAIMSIIIPAVRDFATNLMGMLKYTNSIHGIVNSFDILRSSMQGLMPALKPIGALLLLIFGAVFGAVIVGAIGLIGGLIRAVIGIVTVVVGVFKVIGGILNVFAGVLLIFTGHWDQGWAKMKEGFSQIGSGLLAIWNGLVQTIIGLGRALFYGLLGIITGLISGIIAFFTHLWDVLVGHSIIPDLVNSIVNWILNMRNWVIAHVMALVASFISFFSQLATNPLQFLNTLWNGINNIMGGWPAKMLDFGSNMIRMFIQGIQNMAGQLANVVGGIASNIAGTLGFHSPPKEGPLSDSDQYMPNMLKMMGAGVTANKHHLLTAIGDVTTSMHATLNTPTIARMQTANAYQTGANGNGQPIVYNFNLDSKKIASAQADHWAGELKMNGLNRAWR